MPLNGSLLILLTAVFLFEGCSSLQPLTQDERAALRPTPDEKAWFALKDGRTISAPPYHYVNVPEPSNFIFVFGEEHNVRSSSSSDGCVNITPGALDSSIAAGGASESTAGEELVCRLSDSTYIQFERSNTLHVTPEGGGGYWVIGKVEDRNQNLAFAGRIPYDDIDEILVGKPSLSAPFIAIGMVGAAALGVLLVLAATW